MPTIKNKSSPAEISQNEARFFDSIFQQLPPISFPQSVTQQITVHQQAQKIRINGDMQGLRMGKNRSIPNVCEDFSAERNAADYRSPTDTKNPYKW